MVEILKKRFPEILHSKKYLEQAGFYELFNETPYVFFEDVFSAFIIEKICARDKKMLHRIFDFIEEMATSDDIEVRNLAQVGLLEALWCDKRTHKISVRYMYPNTKKLYENCSMYFDVPK